MNEHVGPLLRLVISGAKCCDCIEAQVFTTAQWSQEKPNAHPPEEAERSSPRGSQVDPECGFDGCVSSSSLVRELVRHELSTLDVEKTAVESFVGGQLVTNTGCVVWALLGLNFVLNLTS